MIVVSHVGLKAQPTLMDSSAKKVKNDGRAEKKQGSYMSCANHLAPSCTSRVQYARQKKPAVPLAYSEVMNLRSGLCLSLVSNQAIGRFVLSARQVV